MSLQNFVITYLLLVSYGQIEITNVTDMSASVTNMGLINYA
jgi:hypothetical protein